MARSEAYREYEGLFLSFPSFPVVSGKQHEWFKFHRRPAQRK